MLELVVGYADADWAVTLMTESQYEYVSAAYATQEAVWLRQLLKDLGVSPILSTPVFEDNQGPGMYQACDQCEH